MPNFFSFFLFGSVHVLEIELLNSSLAWNAFSMVAEWRIFAFLTCRWIPQEATLFSPSFRNFASNERTEDELRWPAVQFGQVLFPHLFFLVNEGVLIMSLKWNSRYLHWPIHLTMHIAAWIDLIRNYGPGTRDGASGFDRAAGTVASCSFVV